MASLRASSAVEENPGKEAKAGAKAGNLLAQGSKRRALGDIGNLVAPLSRVQVGKEKDGAKAKAIKGKDGKDEAQAVLRAAPRTRSQTARQQGISLSTLLQSRSAAAVAEKPAAGPASPLPDIDGEDRSNPLYETAYVNDIYSYYRRIEPKFNISATYMSTQTDINDRMRGILIDWLVEVHLKFKLMPETLFLTVNLIDRFLQARQVNRKQLQLVGVTAMLIASKYEEIWAPEVRDFVYISDKAYTRDQILEMERFMLNTLHYDLTVPTPFQFLSRFIKAAGCQYNKQACTLAQYLVELALVDYSMLRFPASVMAAAAIHVSSRALGMGDDYPRALAKHAKYSRAEVQECAVALVRLMAAAPLHSLIAVHKKYSTPKFLEVAKAEAPLAVLEDNGVSLAQSEQLAPAMPAAAR